MWLMNGRTIASNVGIGNIPNTWAVVGTADFNGDGKGDILWRDPAGNVAMWLMNGSGLLANILIGNIPTHWVVQSANAN